MRLTMTLPATGSAPEVGRTVVQEDARTPAADHDGRYVTDRRAAIKASAPTLSPRTWYGMPAYAKDGNVVCFFKAEFALTEPSPSRRQGSARW